jgi:hypothetical protein
MKRKWRCSQSVLWALSLSLSLSVFHGACFSVGERAGHTGQKETTQAGKSLGVSGLWDKYMSLQNLLKFSITLTIKKVLKNHL